MIRPTSLRPINPGRTDRKPAISARYDQAIAMVATGLHQKTVAEILGCSESRLSKLINSQEGQRRLDFWIKREIKALLPKSVKTLAKVMESENSIASVRAAEAVLDRAGHSKDAAIQADLGGDLVVYMNLF